MGEKERRNFFEERGIEVERVGKREEEGEVMWKETERKKKKMQERKRWEKIITTSYNRWYEAIKNEEYHYI